MLVWVLFFYLFFSEKEIAKTRWLNAVRLAFRSWPRTTSNKAFKFSSLLLCAYFDSDQLHRMFRRYIMKRYTWTQHILRPNWKSVLVKSWMFFLDRLGNRERWFTGLAPIDNLRGALNLYFIIISYMHSNWKIEQHLWIGKVVKFSWADRKSVV